MTILLTADDRSLPKDLVTFIDQNFGDPTDDEVKKGYYQWKTNPTIQKTVKTLCNEIVRSFRDDDPNICFVACSTYAVACEYADEAISGEMTASESSYIKSRGGFWKQDYQSCDSDRKRYHDTHIAPILKNEEEKNKLTSEKLALLVCGMPQYQDYVISFRNMIEKCKEFMGNS